MSNKGEVPVYLTERQMKAIIHALDVTDNEGLLEAESWKVYEILDQRLESMRCE